MAKGGKGTSSASSATRKKHARKAAATLYADEPPPEKHKNVKSKEKGKKKEPRQKVYIPPVKPPPAQPDPLDTTGLARLLPPDLLVVLRKLGKKNALTKISALEELNASFVEKCGKKGSDDSAVSTLVLMMPVWVRLGLTMHVLFLTYGSECLAPPLSCTIHEFVTSNTLSDVVSPYIIAPHIGCPGTNVHLHSGHSFRLSM
jgi:hypothetical protein